MRLTLLMASLLLIGPACRAGAKPPRPQPPPVDTTDYAAILKSDVDDLGRVDYDRLKSHRQPLDRFLDQLATVRPDALAQSDPAARIAFWLNAYNALTLRAIIDHYPVESIRKIDGVWKKRRHRIAGQKLTLDQIEHQQLRDQFHEPRIHFALVCAAAGCPPLRQSPYRGQTLDRQLNDQARRFIARPANFRIDHAHRTVYLSAIFKWFGDDFIKRHSPRDGYAGHKPADRACLHFIAGLLDPAEARWLAGERYTVTYLPYDWSLNRQPDHR